MSTVDLIKSLQFFKLRLSFAACLGEYLAPMDPKYAEYLMSLTHYVVGKDVLPGVEAAHVVHGSG